MEPNTSIDPDIDLIIEYPTYVTDRQKVSKNYNQLWTHFEFVGMVNSGYYIKARVADPNHNLFRDLVENKYFRFGRSQPLKTVVKFTIKSKPLPNHPETSTLQQEAIITEFKSSGGAGDGGYLEFIAVDPASLYLSYGSASGKCYKGRIDQVIKKVIEEYAKPIKLSISKTSGSDQTRWWMMRQDPKTFITSLLDWSVPLTMKKTHWMIGVDNYNLSIREQADYVSQLKGYYRYFADDKADTISRAKFLLNNAFTLTSTKYLSTGLSSTTGEYLDRITDQKEQYVITKNTNTENKLMPKIGPDSGPFSPNDSPATHYGISAIPSIPEIYSAGDLGMQYKQYVAGFSRNLWLNLSMSAYKAMFTVSGHGAWTNTVGLGADTIFVRWVPAVNYEEPSYSGKSWQNGFWIVNGFHHRVVPGSWTTDLYCTRDCVDAVAKSVGNLTK